MAALISKRVSSFGLGISSDSIALSVLDPDHANGSTAVDDFWNDIQTDRRGRVTFRGYNHLAVGETVSLGGNRSVTKIDTVLEQNYVDQYFEASAANLEQVFKNIVSMIQLQSVYFPTLVSESEELSGYISFMDRVGEYMNVTDIKGIIIGDHLFSGADLASNYVPIRTEPLISLAYEHGQLSYTDQNNYSHYIGWYANAAGELLGFYNEGTTVLPPATGDAATDPVFAIRSYGYLGEVDESHGATESDMMYATVQVRKNIVTAKTTYRVIAPRR